MPDARLQRTRATLPEAYRFGDAGPRPSWRPLSEGPRWLQDSCVGGGSIISWRRYSGFTANVIEGEYDTARDPGDER